MLTVAVLLAGLGSELYAVTAAFSVITVPVGAVTFTVSRTVPGRVRRHTSIFVADDFSRSPHKREFYTYPAPAYLRSQESAIAVRQ